MGQVKPGMEADLIVLANNPLDDIKHTRTIQAVISDGVRVDKPFHAGLSDGSLSKRVGQGVRGRQCFYGSMPAAPLLRMICN